CACRVRAREIKYVISVEAVGEEIGGGLKVEAATGAAGVDSCVGLQQETLDAGLEDHSQGQGIARGVLQGDDAATVGQHGIVARHKSDLSRDPCAEVHHIFHCAGDVARPVSDE